MRTIPVLAPVALALTLGACAATGGGVGPAPAGFDASATQFEGWARVEGGEIRLYDQQRDLAQGFPTNCVSAALPRGLQRTAGDLSSLKIRLHGRAAAWADRDGAQTYSWQGSTIINACRRDVVILADRVEALR
jgi:hypothetical protein